MGYKLKDGFQFIDHKLLENNIVIEMERVDEYVEYINNNNIKCVMIDTTIQQNISIEFLRRCPHIEELTFTTSFVTDYSPIYSLKHLKLLALD